MIAGREIASFFTAEAGVMTRSSRAPISGGGAELRTDTGYRGIWYYCGVVPNNPYRYKYSGGLGTYPQQLHPIAVYSREANKTFFCYGGTVRGKQELLHMVSYFDHATGLVPRPRILLERLTEDAHDNPTMMIDDKGFVWIFSNTHGRAPRPSIVHRSVEPYSIDRFERIRETNFSYAQPWFLPGQGLLFLHTRYVGGRRRLCWQTTPDGRRWTRRRMLARTDRGHYQISWQHGKKVGTAFNYHTDRMVEPWSRTNLYYVETTDFGTTWRTAGGDPVRTPIETVSSPALVHDYRSEGRLVYLKNLQFDSRGRPVILYLTCTTAVPGPQGDPRTWHTARWTGARWEIRPFTTSDHAYDYGPLYIEPDGTWRIIAPTEVGPQAWCTGGEMVMWTSGDRGRTWRKLKQLTRGSRYNHTYAKQPVDAHPDFYALWADGNPLRPSKSCLYFTNRTGSHVWRLPTVMKGKFARPEPVEFA